MPSAVLLCIDDERLGLTIRKLVLESAGYTVLTAENGLEGLERFQRDAVDAVVLDFYMPPGMDGGQVARRMRQLNPAVPIILLSAYVHLPDEVLGCVDSYVTKGQPPSVLLQEVSEVLKTRARHTHPELDGDYVAFVDRQRRYVEVTDKLCRLLGYSRAEMLSKSIEDLATAGRVPDRFQRYVEDGWQEGLDMLRHRNGSLIPVSYRARVFPDGCMASVIQPLTNSNND